MKKEILILGTIFLFIGVGIQPAGSVATINKQTVPEPAKIVNIEVHPGLGIMIRVDAGSSPHNKGGTLELTIDAPIMLFGQKHIIKIPVILAHKPDFFFSNFFGFGRCSIRVTFDVDDDGEVDTEATRNGFIFGRHVIFRNFYVPIP